MKTVTYSGPYASLEIRPPYGYVVIERGVPVELDDDLAATLQAEHPGEFTTAQAEKGKG